MDPRSAMLAAAGRDPVTVRLTLRLLEAHAETLRVAARRRTDRMKTNDHKRWSDDYDPAKFLARLREWDLDYYLAVAHFAAFEGGHPGEVGAEALAAFWDRLEDGAVPWFVRLAEPLRVAS